MLASLLLAAIAYVSPVHYPIELAGNFGEPRPNHFHAGIDVKTDRMTGKPLYAMADGFISKVSVGTHGFGKAVYVRHPDGNTSVYVHLDDFAPQIEAAVKRYQYAHKVYATDITFPATMMPVHKGQFIGFSGNTGSSQGPHLHLELHRTQTGDLLDPLAYLKAYVRDTIAPAVYAFKAYPVPGEGTFQHGSSPRVFTFDKGHFSAWGKVGFGVRTMDHMNGVYNSFGSRLIRLYCDGRLVFSADINGLPQSMHRMMNSWGDYDHFMQSRVWFLKSFVEPGNRLPFLKTGQGKGYILFNERREYRLRYVVSDVFGNQTVREFTVLGTPEALGAKPVIAGPEALLTSRDNHWQTDGIRLDVPGRLMAVDRLMKPQLLASARGLSQAVRFVPGNVPLLGWADLAFRIPDATIDPRKLYVAMNLAFACSLRVGEILGLTWNNVSISDEDIAKDDASVYVDKELFRASKDVMDTLGNRDIRFVFPPVMSNPKTRLILKTPKTATSVRRVWLPKTLAYILREWRDTQQKQKEFLGDEYFDYDLVVAHYNGRPCDCKNIEKSFNRLKEDAGLPNVVFHSLRHSSTTYKLKLNHGDIKATQGDTGHAQADMITRVYAHILDEDRKVNAQKFESAFYANPDLRTVKAPAEPQQSALDLSALAAQLQQSSEFFQAFAGLISKQSC